MNNSKDYSGMLSGLTLGANSGSAPAYAGSWGIDLSQLNPYGITGVEVTNDGDRKLGFSGNSEHFITGQAARDLVAGSQGSPFGSDYQGGAPAAPAEPSEPEGITLGQRKETPFLDSYMRAREASRSTGPVSSTMKKYLEE